MFINDRQITISVGASRKATRWQPQLLLISELYERLRTPARSTELLQEYLALTKPQQDELKDVGGFVGGALTGPRRKAGAVAGRDVITLDFDNVPAGGADAILRALDGLGCGYCVYSTRKHHAAAPRLRVVFPLDRTATADEYEPCARRMAEYVGIQYADPTTFEASRLMYWPSCSADSDYIYRFADRPMLSVDGLLKTFTDWRDLQQWPQVPGAAVSLPRLAAKQGDPETKSGIVGAFCRAYDIYTAMDTFLPGIYEPTDIPDRYTFTGGSTAGGAVIYDNGKFLYSHHATDPCGGKLVNAFDLVRLHKFDDLDDSPDIKPDTPTNRLPSYKAMCELAATDTDVTRMLAQESFSTEQEPAPAGEWADALTWDQNGRPHKTLNNIMLLIQNAPELHGCARKNDFSGRIHAAEGLPWRAEPGYWSDADTTELRRYFETGYKGFKPAKQDIRDAVIASAVKQRFHPVREYLESLVWDGRPRLNTLFVDYLGVADEEYTRAVTRKSLVGAVARVMNPGCKFDYMLVFIGKQGRGKSSIIYKLAGGEDWFTDSLVTFDGQKAFEAVTGKWLVEVPEMHAFDKTTMNQAKAFISKQSDFYRAAYAEFPEDRKRQCVFFGTTNNADCLRDETGGRRFWPLDIDAVERKKDLFTELSAERDQIWAEAVVYWRLGETLYLPPELEEQASMAQEEHRERHPWEDTITDFLERGIPENWADWDLSRRMTFWSGGVAGDIPLVPRTKVCVREIWQEALGQPLAMLDQQKARAISGVLNRAKGWQRSSTVRCGKPYGTQKGFTRGLDL